MQCEASETAVLLGAPIDEDQDCSNCGGTRIEGRDASDPSVGYYDTRPWCMDCNAWAD